VKPVMFQVIKGGERYSCSDKERVFKPSEGGTEAFAKPEKRAGSRGSAFLWEKLNGALGERGGGRD